MMSETGDKESGSEVGLEYQGLGCIHLKSQFRGEPRAVSQRYFVPI